MTKYFCDLCEQEQTRIMIDVKVCYGENSHNGSLMYKEIEVCWECILKIPKLETQVEYDELKKICG